MEFSIWWVLAIVLFLGSFVYAWFSLAPWFPTKKQDLERLNKIADLKPGQKFLEVGCGDGRVCHYMAQKNPKAEIVGIELAILFYFISKIKSSFWRTKNCRISFGNALNKDFSEFDVIYVFGLTETVNEKLKTKLEKELRNDAMFVSYNFEMKSWKGKNKKDKPTPESSSFYIYTKKSANADFEMS